MPRPGPGWYADPAGDPSQERFWDGSAWSQSTRASSQPSGVVNFAAPTGPARAASETSATAATQQPASTNWTRLVALLFGIGGIAITAFTSVSLLSGMGQVVFGAVLAGLGVVIAFVGNTELGTRITCVILAALAISSAVYDNHQLDLKRQEIQNIFPTPGAS
jgi:hypothetical protein